MKGRTCFYDVESLDGAMRICLKGEMDHHNAVGVRGEIDELIYRERPKKLLLNMSEIGFMDSSGLGFIMGRYALMEKLGGTLILENPNERIVKIFELAGLQRIVKVENVKEEKIK
ncbi:MAG: STAS domain-containing protein [Ruminococcaceae bacterium]|nr:STAS domain-containing protein [Oscillospiraceae bacterium]